MAERRYLIFVTPVEFNEYSDAIAWTLQNLSHSNVLSISLDDVYILNRSILEVVNKYNDSMLGPYEDTWIHSKDIKLKVYKELSSLKFKFIFGRERKLLNEILRLLKVSIDSDKNIYFLF